MIKVILKPEKGIQIDETKKYLFDPSVVQPYVDASAENATKAEENANKAQQTFTELQTYTDNAKTDINNTIEQGKADINLAVDEGRMEISDTIEQAVEDVKAEAVAAAVAAAEGAIQDAANTAIQIATDHTNTVIKPELQTYVDSSNANATIADNAATVSRTWATGTDEEVQAIEDDEHSSRTYANFAMALANAPENVPVLESTLLATNVIQGEPWAGGEVTTPLVLVSDDNHPIAIKGMAGASATGYQIIDSNGLGESDFEHYATGDRYGTRITNKNNTSGTTSNIDFYQSNAGRSVLDLSEVQTILAPALLGAMYPVGSIYITTNATCPIADLGVGTWELVAEDRVLQGAGTRGTVGTTLNESLPNITGVHCGPWGADRNRKGVFSGDWRTGEVAGQGRNFPDAGNDPGWEIQFNASRSSTTYQDNAPVQQDAYLVNIFRRIQ